MIVPVLKTKSKIGFILQSYNSSFVSFSLKVLSNSNSWFSINFVIPSTFHFQVPSQIWVWSLCIQIFLTDQQVYAKLDVKKLSYRSLRRYLHLFSLNKSLKVDVCFNTHICIVFFSFTSVTFNFIHSSSTFFSLLL